MKWQKVNMGSDNGLASNMRPAITWTLNEKPKLQDNGQYVMQARMAASRYFSHI